MLLLSLIIYLLQPQFLFLLNCAGIFSFLKHLFFSHFSTSFLIGCKFFFTWMKRLRHYFFMKSFDFWPLQMYLVLHCCFVSFTYFLSSLLHSIKQINNHLFCFDILNTSVFLKRRFQDWSSFYFVISINGLF